MNSIEVIHTGIEIERINYFEDLMKFDNIFLEKKLSEILSDKEYALFLMNFDDKKSAEIMCIIESQGIRISNILIEISKCMSISIDEINKIKNKIKEIL